MTAFDLPDSAEAALAELDALLRVNDSFNVHRVPPGPGTGLAAIMWLRAHEGGDALLRQFPPRTHVGDWPMPRVSLFLTARWMYEGALLARWVAKDPGERSKRVLADAAVERGKLLQSLGLSVPPKHAADLQAAAASAKGLPNVSQMTEDFGDPGAYSIYRALCEPAHWGGLWLAESVHDGPGGHWLPHLVTVPSSLRMILAATGSICALDVESHLARIPSCINGRGVVPPAAGK